MRIVSLKKLVEDNDIQVVQVSLGEGVTSSFEVGSPDYTEQELFLVKGEYKIGKGEKNENVLKVYRLEKELNISLNPVVVVADNVAPEEEKKLEEFINTPVTAVVFNRKTLQNAPRHTKRRFVNAYAESVLESFEKNFGAVDRADFAIVEIDWDNRQVAIKSLADKVEE